MLDCSNFVLKTVSDVVGLGLFAKNFIVKDTILGEYAGMIGLGDGILDYAWNYPSLYNGQKLYIDGNHYGNCYKYINDLMDHNV